MAIGPDEAGADTVLVVDDHELVGATIVLALAGLGLRALRCPVTTTAGILKVAEQLGGRLVLLDLNLGVGTNAARLDELELVRGFTERGWRTLVVSATTNELQIAAAVAAGAIGFVAKAATLDEFLSAVSHAALGRSLLSPTDRMQWLDIHRRGRAASRRQQVRLRRLTSREHEILKLLARGERAATIAQDATVSLTTVRSQIRSILTKLEVNSQLEAAALIRDDYEAVQGLGGT